jgi:hypothetical protein
MRINLKETFHPSNSLDKRKFLLIPRWNRNESFQYSIRWLEYAVIRHRYKCGYYYDMWCEECFIDNPQNLTKVTV